jgi:PAS domain S-box-containing protein
MEIVRVNFNNGRPSVVPQEKLQDKKGRYYFDDAFILNEREVFVSPLDLNIERGKIEQPLKPMIRFATPVFDDCGEKRGIVLLNYFGSELLDRFSKQAGDSNPSQAMLLNAAGYWLRGPNHEDDWGFMYEDRKDRTLASVYPDAWERIKSEEFCQFETARGLFTSRTVYPLLEGQRTSTGSGEAFSPSMAQLEMRTYQWKVVSFAPSDALYAERNNQRMVAALVLALLAPVIFLGSWLLARAIHFRRLAEDALRQSEEMHRIIFHEAIAPVFVFDSDKNFIESNQAGLDLLGYSMEELLNMNVQDVDAASEVVLPEREQLLSGGVIVNYERKLKRKDGAVVTVLDNSRSLTDDQGRVVGMQSTLVNITEHRLLEERLRQAEKMEAIGTLAGGVAHDLNNILGGITGYPELLLLNLPEDSPLRDSLQIIKDSGEKAAAIVQDMLTLAKSGVTLTEVVDLNDVISDYLESPIWEKAQAFHPDVQLKTELEADLMNIKGSSAHLSEIVMNLVSNAAEAMPAGGQLLISTANQYLDKPITGYDNVEEGEYAVLSISDTGVGLTPEDAERIFEPFFTKKTLGRSGTGLGTAIVWRTIKDHNGYIEVRSEEGKGTTFTLYFPISREQTAETKPDVSMEEYMGSGQFILIVDDVKEQRGLARGMLEALGYSAASVSSGEEAVEYLKSNSADLLVLDMIMDPGIDGLETYKRIIELHPGQKAIIASGFSESDKVREAQALGAGAYIRKPYTIEKIGLAVKEELEK